MEVLNELWTGAKDCCGWTEPNLNTGQVISGMQGCGESGKSSGTTSSKSSTPSRLRPNTTSQYLQRIVEYVRCRLAQAGDSTADGKH